jgi:hypothetical protein
MVRETITFGPDIDDRALDKEVDAMNDALADTSATISPNVDTSGLGDIGMGVSGGGGMRGGLGDDVATLVPMADYRNRLLEDILDEIQAGGGVGDGDGEGRGKGLLGGLGGMGGLLGIGGLAGAGLGLGALGGSLLGRLSPGNLISGIRERIGGVIEGIQERIPSPGDLLPDIGNIIPNLNLEAGAIAGGVGGALGGAVATGGRFLGGVGKFLGGIGRGVAGGISSIAALPSVALSNLEGRGITDIIPENLLQNAGRGSTMAATGPLGGLFGTLFGGGRMSTPGQRRAAQARDARYRRDPAANPSQVQSNPNFNVDLSIDPSGLNDLRRDLKRELENDLVPQVVSQVERELSIGLGGN